MVCKILLLLTSVYLLIIEFTAIARRKLKYFYNVSRLFNVITPFLLIFNIGSEDTESSKFWTVQTWLALSIWLRFLLYLRTLNMFSYMIRMIIACLQDSTTFIVVLIIGVLAFADSRPPTRFPSCPLPQLPTLDFSPFLHLPDLGLIH